MRISVSRLIAAAALASLLALLTGIASASASPRVECTNEGTIKFSPGLSATPQVQKIKIKGKLTGCSGEEPSVTGATYVAHLTTVETEPRTADGAVVCPTEVGYVFDAGGPITVEWSPRATADSTGGFALNAVVNFTQENNNLEFEKGPFAGIEAHPGTGLAEKLTAQCPVILAEGRKLTKLTFTGLPFVVG